MSFLQNSLEEKEIPDDARLPGLALLLRPGRFLELLGSRDCGQVSKASRAEITYLRYKPGTNCLVAYEITYRGSSGNGSEKCLLYAKLYTSRDFANALEKANHTQWIELPGRPPMLPLSDEQAIIYFYPNDCLIDGLRILAEPKKLQRLLYEHDPRFPAADWRISDRQIRLTTVRYKPERRAVVRIRVKAKNRTSGDKRRVAVYARIYADDRGEPAFALQRRLHDFAASSNRVIVPTPIVYVAERRLMLMEAFEGDILLNRIHAGDREAIMTAAAALAELQSYDDSSVPLKSFDSLLEDAAATGELLCHVVPEMLDETEEIMARLGTYRCAFGQDRVGFVHGDFYHGQVIVQAHRAAIIDFDRSYFGEVAADAGNFCAHLRLLEIDSRVSGRAQIEQDFLAAYQDTTGRKLGETSLRFHTAHGLFLLAVGPFRRMEAGWRDKTKLILDKCLRILREQRA